MPLYVTRKEKRRRIILVVLCLLFSIGAGVWIYFTNKKIEDIESGPEREDSLVKLRTRLNEQLKIMSQNEDALIDFSEPVGWRIKYSDSQDRYTASFIYSSELKNYLDSWVEEFAKRGITKYAKWSAPSEELERKARLDIPTVFTELENIYSNIITKINTAREEISQSEREEKKINEEQKEEVSKLASEIYGGDPKAMSGVTQEIITLSEKLSEEQSKSTAAIEDMSKEYKEKQKELDDLKNKNVQEIAVLNKQVEDMSNRYTTFTARLKEAESRMEADSVIKLLDQERQVAYIDITRADKIWRGTKFKIFSLLRGGDKVIRGYTEVIDIGDQYSKVAITRIIDDKNPPQVGDYLYDEYFERGKKRSFAFTGNLTGRLGIEQFQTRLTNIGDEVKKTIDGTTTYLVIGKGYEKTPEYQRAKELNIKRVTERDLYEYLGLTF